LAKLWRGIWATLGSIRYSRGSKTHPDGSWNIWGRWSEGTTARRRRYLDVDQNLAVFNLQRIHGDLHVRIIPGLSGVRIPCPAVPWADHFAFLNHPLPARPATGQADVIHRGDRPVDVGDADDLVAAGEFLSFVGGGKFGLGSEFDKHSSRLSASAFRFLCRATLGWADQAPVPTRFSLKADG